MSQRQTQGLGGLGNLKSTADLSGQVTDVTNGNPIGSTYKNGAGLFVIYGAAGYFALAGANARCIGVLDNTPKAGQAGNIQSVRGTTAKVLSGGIIAVGALLQTDAYGRVATAASSAQVIVAQALEAATAAGQLIEVVLMDSYVA